MENQTLLLMKEMSAYAIVKLLFSNSTDYADFMPSERKYKICVSNILIWFIHIILILPVSTVTKTLTLILIYTFYTRQLPL